jgi:zinc-ribbon domain
MYCPDCGAENSRSQKFCTRCGTNLIAIGRAREIVSEIATGAPVPQFEASSMIKAVAWISILGFLFVTIGSIVIMGIDGGRTPIPVFFGFCGFGALVLICRHLLGLIKYGGVSGEKGPGKQADYLPPVMSKATNRALNEQAPTYNSIVEEPTQQFESERQKRS